MAERHTEEVPWAILARGTGEWAGEETMAPAPWAPDGQESTGRLSARLVLGGRGLASAYTQEVAGEVALTTHTLLHWDGDGERFRMHFFNAPGADPIAMEGERDGNRLVFEGDGPMGDRMRQTFVYGEAEIRVATEARGEDGWALQFEGSYRPVTRG